MKKGPVETEPCIDAGGSACRDGRLGRLVWIRR